SSRRVYDPPAACRHFYGVPMLVAHVYVDAGVGAVTDLGHSDERLVLFAVVNRLPLEHAEGFTKRLSADCAARVFVPEALDPTLHRLGLQAVVLHVLVERERDVGLAVGIAPE